MVLRSAAEGTTPVPGSSGVHANDQSLHNPQADLESGLSGVNDWPLHDLQRDLEAGLSRVRVNDWPIRESQEDREADRAYEEKTRSASTGSPSPPAYFSFIGSHNKPSAQTPFYASRPDATNDNMEDVELGQASDEPESIEEWREKIRAAIQAVVVEQLAKKKDEEDNAKMKDSIIRVIFWVSILGFFYFVSKFSS